MEIGLGPMDGDMIFGGFQAIGDRHFNIGRGRRKYQEMRGPLLDDFPVFLKSFFVLTMVFFLHGQHLGRGHGEKKDKIKVMEVGIMRNFERVHKINLQLKVPLREGERERGLPYSKKRKEKDS